jgi:cation diffusion facilitator family transporter
VEDRSTAAREKSRAAIFSVASNAFLVAAKFGVGLAIGSVSVISEAIHSAVDLLAAVIAWFAVRFSDQPADREHPYGHGKMENLSGAIEALLIFVAAAWIIWEAVHKLLAGGDVESPGWGALVMAVSAALNFAVSANLMRVGRKHDSMALVADAMHLRVDVWTSLGVLGGMLVLWSCAWLIPGVPMSWIDPVTAIVVALLIVKAAWDLTRQATGALLDEALPETDLERIRDFAREDAKIKSLHDLRTRKSGAERMVDAHIAVPADLTVYDGHAAAHGFKDRILLHWPNANVNVHLDPCDGSCKAPCLSGCLLGEAARSGLHEDWKRRIRALA